MVDYQNRKVAIFTGINDAPIAPTSTSGGNISHFYDLFNTLIDLLQADITTIESAAAVDYSTDITNLQNSITTLQTTTGDNTTSISSNSSSITTNIASINTLNTNFTNLQTSVTNNSTSISSLDGRVTTTENDVITINQSLGGIAESFPNPTFFYLDLNAGSDSNDGLSAATPFLTLGKLIETLNSKHIPEALSINVIGTITETIDFSRLSTLVSAKGKNNRASITFTTNQANNFIINHGSELIKTNNNYPLRIAFTKCDFLANGDSLKIINSNSYFQFIPPCNFDTSADNTEEILYCENTDIYFQTFGNDLVFNNSNTASLTSAIKLVKAQGKFEKCTVNDIGTFVIADDRSFVINTFNSHVMTNVTTYYDLRNNSFLRTNRYSIFGEPEILMDGTSTMNNLVLFDKTLINPPLNSSIKLINNAPKDYYVDFNGWSGVTVNMTYELYADGDTLSSQNNKLAKGRDLSINFSGTTSIDHVVLGFHLHDFV